MNKLRLIDKFYCKNQKFKIIKKFRNKDIKKDEEMEIEE